MCVPSSRGFSRRLTWCPGPIWEMPRWYWCWTALNAGNWTGARSGHGAPTSLGAGAGTEQNRSTPISTLVRICGHGTEIFVLKGSRIYSCVGCRALGKGVGRLSVLRAVSPVSLLRSGWGSIWSVIWALKLTPRYKSEPDLRAKINPRPWGFLMGSWVSWSVSWYSTARRIKSLLMFCSVVSALRCRSDGDFIYLF